MHTNNMVIVLHLSAYGGRQPHHRAAKNAQYITKNNGNEDGAEGVAKQATVYLEAPGFDTQGSSSSSGLRASRR